MAKKPTSENNLPSNWSEISRSKEGGYTVTTSNGDKYNYDKSLTNWTEKIPAGSKYMKEYKKGGLVVRKSKVISRKGGK